MQTQEDARMEAFAAGYQNQTTSSLVESLSQNHSQRRLDLCHIIASILKTRLGELTQSQHTLLQKAEAEYQQMVRAVALLDKDSSSWYTLKVGNKTHTGTVASKVYGRSGVEAQIKGEFLINGPNLIPLIYETDLFTQWVPFCCESKLIKEISPTQKLVFVKFGFPYISTREIVFLGQTFDRFAYNGTVIIHMKGVTGNQDLEKEHGVKLASPGKKGTQFFSEDIVIELDIRNSVYNFRTYSNVNLKVLFLPQFVVNFFSERIGGLVFEKAVDRAKSLQNTQWQKRLEADSAGVYHMANRKIQTWGGKKLEYTN